MKKAYLAFDVIKDSDVDGVRISSPLPKKPILAICQSR
jgi:hypothetical protein